MIGEIEPIRQSHLVLLNFDLNMKPNLMILIKQHHSVHFPFVRIDKNILHKYIHMSFKISEN